MRLTYNEGLDRIKTLSHRCQVLMDYLDNPTNPAMKKMRCAKVLSQITEKTQDLYVKLYEMFHAAIFSSKQDREEMRSSYFNTVAGTSRK